MDNNGDATKSWGGVYMDIVSRGYLEALRYPITLHDNMHEFRQGIWTGTATFEANMYQQLERMCHDPLLQVFLDV